MVLKKLPFMTGDGAHLVAVTFILHPFFGAWIFWCPLIFLFSTPSIEDQFFIHQNIFAHENRWKPLPIDDSYITLGQWSYSKRPRCSRRFSRHPTQAVPARLGSNARSPGRIRPSWWTAEMPGSTNGFRWVSPENYLFLGSNNTNFWQSWREFFGKSTHCLGWEYNSTPVSGGGVMIGRWWWVMTEWCEGLGMGGHYMCIYCISV